MVAWDTPAADIDALAAVLARCRECAAVIAAPQRRRVRGRTVGQFIVLACIWGSTWLVIKTQLGVVPVAWSVGYRFLIGGAVVGALTLALGKRLSLPAKGHALALSVAVLQFGLNFNLVYEAERHVTSGLVALIFALLVVPNALLARALLGQRIAPLFVVGSGLGIAGVALLVGHDIDIKGPDVAIGLALGAAAVLCASGGNVLQATRLARGLALEPLLAVTMIYGGLLASGWAWATTGPPVAPPDGSYVAGIVYLAVVASALAFRLYYALIREIGPARAGYVNVVVPVVAMSLSTLFEGFAWTWSGALGAALALAGLVIALRSRS